MHNDHYQQLQIKSTQDPLLLGATLPAAINGQLEISTQQCSAQDICASIEQLQASHGWVMYRDSVILATQAPTRTDFIEGEWCNPLKTLKVKHLHGDSYLCVVMEQSTPGEQLHCFTEQSIYVRSDLKTPQNSMAMYRLWYIQAQSGDDHGRWLPLTQQFIGFSQTTATQNQTRKEQK